MSSVLYAQLDFAEDTLDRKMIFKSAPSPEISLGSDAHHIRPIRQQPLLKSDKVYFSYQSDVSNQKVSSHLVFDGRAQTV